MGLTPRVVESDDDVELMRQIRNDCREQMTRHREAITPEQQAAWWKRRDAQRIRAWLYQHGDAMVGFGMLRYVQERWWITLGLFYEWRGKGYGTVIYRHLLEAAAGAQVWAEVGASNLASLRAAEKAGFVRQTFDGRVHVLRAHKEQS